ncbi:MAG: hypothetical protein Q4G35_07100 [Propionibacteriaceae bacterium]|nr:hypothetical protein [Propionibacteriaceae bacterium]
MRDERGSAGVLITTAMSIVLLIAFTFSATFIAWFAAARHAEQAAELAALAATSASVRGDAPCAAAADVARRNGVAVSGCDVRGGGRHVVVEVTVEAPLRPHLPGAPATFHRSATAGTGQE